MKILCTADIHISDWHAYSDLDEIGRPSRLMQFIDLANDINAYCEKEKIDLILIGGDISHRAQQPPIVLDVIGDFFRIISQTTKVIVVPGNHDISTKSNKSIAEQCILFEICKDMENVSLYCEPTIIQMQDLRFGILPWTKYFDIPQEFRNDKFDVFLSHGMVAGSENHEGYLFKTGFKQSDLFQMARLSVLGDIHQPQFFEQNGSKILIPGTPLQNSWNDSPITGFWIADVVIGCEATLKHISTETLRDNYYHKFLISETQEPTDRIHVRKPKQKLRKTTGQKTQTKELLTVDLNFFREEACRLIDSEVVENKDLIKDKFISYLDNYERSESIISDVRVKDLFIKNFMSIDEFSLDFSDFEKICVICGPNGSGKTSIVESLYWVLTGKTTKRVPVGSLLNKYKSSEEGVLVKLTLEINGEDYVIERSRRGGAPGLILKKLGEDVVYDKESVGSTQDFIYKLLGLTETDISLFTYFSTTSPVLFGNMSDTEKVGLLSRLSKSDVVQALRAKIKVDEDQLKHKVVENQSRVITQREFQENKKKALNKLIETSATQKSLSEKILFLTQSREELGADESERLTELDESIHEKSKEISEERLKYDRLNSEIKKLAETAKKAKKELLSLDSKTCFTCGQEIVSETKLSEIKQRLTKEAETSEQSLRAKLPLLESIKTQGISLRSEKEELEKERTVVAPRQKKRTELSQELNRLNGLLSKDFSTEKAMLEKEIEELKDQVNLSQSSVDTLVKEKEILTYLTSKLLKNSGRFVKSLNENALKFLVDRTMKNLIDTNIEVSSTGLNLMVSFNGRKSLSYGEISAGQKRILDLALMLTLNEIFSEYIGSEKGVLGISIYDEVVSFLDMSYVDVAKTLLDTCVSGKVLLITHETRLADSFDRKIVLRKLGDNDSTSYERNF